MFFSVTTKILSSSFPFLLICIAPYFTWYIHFLICTSYALTTFCTDSENMIFPCVFYRRQILSNLFTHIHFKAYLNILILLKFLFLWRLPQTYHFDWPRLLHKVKWTSPLFLTDIISQISIWKQLRYRL